MEINDLTGWEPGFTGSSFFKEDRGGTLWQAIPDEATGKIKYKVAYIAGVARPLTEDKLKELFG